MFQTELIKSSVKKNFADGIFSIGCCCELSITYGFEIMMAHESSRHFCQAQPKPQLQLSWGLSLHYSQCDPATRHPPATPAGIVDFLLAIAILVH